MCTDSLSEARVSNAVAIILCRSCSESQSDQITNADNHMMVKSSMICQGLVHHYRSANDSEKAEKKAELIENANTNNTNTNNANNNTTGNVTGNTTGSANTNNSPTGPPPVTPNATIDATIDRGFSFESQRKKSVSVIRNKGPRMSVSSDNGFIGINSGGGSATRTSMTTDEILVKHFDLHVVHQLFSDMVVYGEKVIEKESQRER